MPTHQWPHFAARPRPHSACQLIPLQPRQMLGARLGATLSAIMLSALSMALLVSCSVPDGPDIADTATSPSSGSVAVPEEIAAPITLNGPGQLLPVSATAEMKGLVFELEVARTPAQQALGLMFRSELPDNRGMLFPFDSPRRASFWMKDVPVPLDMVFLRNGEVIAIAPSVPPCPATPCPTYGPDRQIVDMVLELRSGRAAEIGLQEGDSVVVSELTVDRQSSNL